MALHNFKGSGSGSGITSKDQETTSASLQGFCVREPLLCRCIQQPPNLQRQPWAAWHMLQAIASNCWPSQGSLLPLNNWSRLSPNPAHPSFLSTASLLNSASLWQKFAVFHRLEGLHEKGYKHFRLVDLINISIKDTNAGMCTEHRIVLCTLQDMNK